MEKQAESFRLSSKLQSISSVLMKNLAGQSLEEAMQAEYVSQPDMEWISSLLGEINWHGPNYQKSNPDIVVTATSLRPFMFREAFARGLPASFYDKAHDYFAGKGKLDTKDLRNLQQVLCEASSRILLASQPSPDYDPD